MKQLLQKITEKYGRNVNRPVSQDPACVEYDIKGEKVSDVLTCFYHIV